MGYSKSYTYEEAWGAKRTVTARSNSEAYSKLNSTGAFRGDVSGGHFKKVTINW